MIIRTKQLRKNKNIILSINNNDILVNQFSCKGNLYSDGDIISDQKLMKMLKCLESKKPQKHDPYIHQWVV